MTPVPWRDPVRAALVALPCLLVGLSACDAAKWQAPHLEELLKELAESAGAKLGDMMQPIRVALTGGTVSEPVPELLVAVGREESLRRIASAT